MKKKCSKDDHLWLECGKIRIKNYTVKKIKYGFHRKSIKKAIFLHFYHNSYWLTFFFAVSLDLLLSKKHFCLLNSIGLLNLKSVYWEKNSPEVFRFWYGLSFPKLLWWVWKLSKESRHFYGLFQFSMIITLMHFTSSFLATFSKVWSSSDNFVLEVAH